MKVLFTFFSIFVILNTSAQTIKEYQKLAENYYDKGDYKKALKQVDLALKLDSNNSELLILKGNTLESLQKYDSALNVYSKLIELYPNNAIALNQRGLLLNKIQEYDYALQDFDRALYIQNADSIKLSLYINRGAVKQNIRDFKGAYDDYILAYKIDSLNTGTLNNLAAVCDEIGKGDETLGYLFKILKIDSNFIGAYGNIGFKYQEMGDYQTAIKYFDKVLSIDPKDALGLNNRGYNKYKLGDLKAALIDINKSLLFYPANSFAYKNRALVFLAQNKVTDACKDLEKAQNLGFTKMYGDEVEKLKIANCE